MPFSTSVPTPITWTDVYLFCFAFGFFMSLIALAAGQLGSHHAGADAGHGHDGLLPSAGHAARVGGRMAGRADKGARQGTSPFNLSTGSAFLAWFGGTGYLATRYGHWGLLTALLTATGAGLIGGGIVYLFLAKVLLRVQEHLDPADFDLVGVAGEVSAPIRPGGIGEILYSQQGARRAAPARSDGNETIPAGVEVVVLRYEQGIAYVRTWETFAHSTHQHVQGA